MNTNPVESLRTFALSHCTKGAEHRDRHHEVRHGAVVASW